MIYESAQTTLYLLKEIEKLKFWIDFLKVGVLFLDLTHSVYYFISAASILYFVQENEYNLHVKVVTRVQFKNVF